MSRESWEKKEERWEWGLHHQERGRERERERKVSEGYREASQHHYCKGERARIGGDTAVCEKGDIFEEGGCLVHECCS